MTMLGEAGMQATTFGQPTLLLMLLALAACATPRTNQHAAQLYQGAYTIEGAVAGTAVNATLSFDGQKFYFETNHGSCSGEWPRFYKPTSVYVNFNCGPLSIRFSHK